MVVVVYRVCVCVWGGGGGGGRGGGGEGEGGLDSEICINRKIRGRLSYMDHEKLFAEIFSTPTDHYLVGRFQYKILRS